MKQIVLILVVCSSLAWGQDGKQASLFEKAPADWKSEIIPFPLGFAPQIKLVGREELRFAPGMYKPEAEDYFTYTFIWWLDGQYDITGDMLKQNLKHYYVGLYKAVSKKEIKDTSSFETSVYATREPSWTSRAQQVYRGTVKWKDPFVTENPQTLNMKIAAWQCPDGKHTAVLFLASPQETGHRIWKTMAAMDVGSCDSRQ